MWLVLILDFVRSFFRSQASVLPERRRSNEFAWSAVERKRHGVSMPFLKGEVPGMPSPMFSQRLLKLF